MADVFLKHQLVVARHTLTLTDAGARILGGMTKEEAYNLLARHGQLRKRPRRKNAK